MTETGTFLLSDSQVSCGLGIFHLRRFWEKTQARKTGRLLHDALLDEWNLDNALLSALGLGLEQTIVHLYNSPGDFDDFEAWVLQTLGGPPDPDRVSAFNLLLKPEQRSTIETNIENVLTDEEWEQWQRDGYIILREAVAREDCEATIRLICDHLGIDRSDPSTWYREHPDRKGIMVQLFQHPQLEKNRQATRIRKAYEQLWRRTDIQVNTDKVGFNPPETPYWHFPGQRMHWDVSLKTPIPFGTQGILYLSDTAANQGAFTLVPGFHRKVEAWLGSLPPGADPRKQDIGSLGPVPIAANAGDFIIWHHALPHGSSPNNANLPRYVQYFNYSPVDMEVREEWI